MQQSRLESFIEGNVNTASGFLIAFLVQEYIVKPFWHLDISTKESLAITVLFTFIAIARNYFWRRFFNNRVHMLVHAWVKRWMS